MKRVSKELSAEQRDQHPKSQRVLKRYDISCASEQHEENGGDDWQHHGMARRVLANGTLKKRAIYLEVHNQQQYSLKNGLESEPRHGGTALFPKARGAGVGRTGWGLGFDFTAVKWLYILSQTAVSVLFLLGGDDFLYIQLSSIFRMRQRLRAVLTSKFVELKHGKKSWS
jgi:hypothetical protein